MNGELKWLKDNWLKIAGALIAAGYLVQQVQANTAELANRRAVVESVPHLQNQVEDIDEKLDKILCRLGEQSACPPGKK